MTTAFVAAIGGHISELEQLARRLPEGDRAVWITNDSPQTRDLLRGRTIEYVPFIGERDLLGVARATATAGRLLRRHRVDRVISTGSAIALGYLPVAAALGVEAHYIESSTRVRQPSMTGGLLARMPGVRCWWQFPDPPSRFRSVGGVYDRYLATARIEPRQLRRVVVTVGTTDRSFRRLLSRLVAILPSDADVLWQTGHTEVDDLGIDGRRLVPESELIRAIERADVVVTHAGAGSLAVALRAGHVPVFVPRRAAHDEQIDDHQVELADWAGRQGLAVTAEADEIGRHHLTAAAGRTITRRPVGELVLT